MGPRKALTDDWLFWDPEHLEGYPHSGNTVSETGHTARCGDAGTSRQPVRWRVFEDLLIYAAGVASALIGVGLVVLLGSFVSAYSMLAEVNRAGNAPDGEPPGLNPDKLALLADAVTTATPPVQFGPGGAADDVPKSAPEGPH